MWIGHRKEIRKLTFRELALRRIRSDEGLTLKTSALESLYGSSDSHYQPSWQNQIILEKRGLVLCKIIPHNLLTVEESLNDDFKLIYFAFEVLQKFEAVPRE